MRLEIPHDNRLFVVSAPSGSGKTSLIKKALSESKNLKLSISYTTRPPRPAEIDKQDYFFVDKNIFQSMITQGDFLEYATVFGERYGTSKLFIENALANGHDVILEIDWQGARQIKTHYPDAFSIFILPPSFQVLQERLEQRAQDSKEVIDSRMKQAMSEAKHFDEYNYIVVNDDFDRASTEFINVLAENIGDAEIERSKERLNETLQALGLNKSEVNNE